jgi:hypothetical protein
MFLEYMCCRDNGRALVTWYVTAKASSKPNLGWHNTSAKLTARQATVKRAVCVLRTKPISKRMWLDNGKILKRPSFWTGQIGNVWMRQLSFEVVIARRSLLQNYHFQEDSSFNSVIVRKCIASVLLNSELYKLKRNFLDHLEILSQS